MALRTRIFSGLGATTLITAMGLVGFASAAHADECRPDDAGGGTIICVAQSGSGTNANIVVMTFLRDANSGVPKVEGTYNMGADVHLDRGSRPDDPNRQKIGTHLGDTGYFDSGNYYWRACGDVNRNGTSYLCTGWHQSPFH